MSKLAKMILSIITTKAIISVQHANNYVALTVIAFRKAFHRQSMRAILLSICGAICSLTRPAQSPGINIIKKRLVQTETWIVAWSRKYQHCRRRATSNPMHLRKPACKLHSRPLPVDPSKNYVSFVKSKPKYITVRIVHICVHITVHNTAWNSSDNVSY